MKGKLSLAALAVTGAILAMPATASAGHVRGDCWCKMDRVLNVMHLGVCKGAFWHRKHWHHKRYKHAR